VLQIADIEPAALIACAIRCAAHLTVRLSGGHPHFYVKFTISCSTEFFSCHI
jgi:hypothetical protein